MLYLYLYVSREEEYYLAINGTCLYQIKNTILKCIRNGIPKEQDLTVFKELVFMPDADNDLRKKYPEKQFHETNKY